MQVKVREALATFTTKGLPDDVRVAVRRDGERVAPVLTGAPDDGSGFLAAVATLLLDVGLRLRRCQRATCATVFLAVGRQDYCSARCSQTERTARWRTKRDGHAKASDAGAPPVRRVRRRRHPVQRDARS
ncbi:MAG: hypothetical protein E6I48_14325 [Chloroflexi bacterium]|nr:MAG: hypothetical protein E6I48_14325 [Chloroflexota bacterium]